MSRFIKLSNLIINTSYIQKIEVYEKKYVLRMMMATNNNKLKGERICITNDNCKDYHTIKQFINNIYLSS